MNLASALLGISALGATAALDSQDPAWDPLKGRGEPKSGAQRPAPKPMPPAVRESYHEAIRRTAEMAQDEEAKRLAAKHGLDVLSLTWEDTGRYKNSAVGPNISDMTIQVAMQDARGKFQEARAMPVIRFPNFSDRTADLDPRDFTLLVGNQRGRALRRISLYDFLQDPTQYLSNPASWRGKNRTLLAPRDSRVLVSAQAAFLPVPKEGQATFNPVLFNYQSTSGDPAVLTVLATRQGTSVTIIDNKRDAFGEGAAWGQRLFHNQNGQRASLTGTRLSEFAGPGGGVAPSEQKSSGLNMVLLIQIPLKQKNPMRVGGFGGGGAILYESASPAPGSVRRSSDVENAVIGHGDYEGPFTEIDNLAIERDERFPVRVTVQFYKATSNGVVNVADLKTIAEEIDSVYARGDAVGSLVVGGNTGRITEYDGPKVQPPDWWQQFWKRYEQNTGNTRAEAIAHLRRLLGRDYQTRPVTELYLRDVLRTKQTPN